MTAHLLPGKRAAVLQKKGEEDELIRSVLQACLQADHPGSRYN